MEKIVRQAVLAKQNVESLKRVLAAVERDRDDYIAAAGRMQKMVSQADIKLCRFLDKMTAQEYDEYLAAVDTGR